MAPNSIASASISFPNSGSGTRVRVTPFSGAAGAETEFLGGPFPNGSSGTRATEQNYGSLPFYFEQNVGQADEGFDFMARGSGYTLGLSATEAVLALPRTGDVDVGCVKSSQTHRDFGAPVRLRGLDTPYKENQCSPGFSEPRPLGSGLGVPPVADAPGSLDPAAHHTPLATDYSFVHMQIVGANPAATATGFDQLITKVNYYLGNDPEQWHTGVPTFAQVHYQDVYPGIDLVYYGKGQDLEYDFVVAPGADPGQIALSFDGADSIDIDSDGSLVVNAGEHAIRQPAPFIYQEANGVRQQVMGEFRIQDSELETHPSLVTFELGDYDVMRPLVMDPAVVLGYSTYLGGGGDEVAYDIAIDDAGSAYVVGETRSSTFPVVNPVQQSYAGSTDAFIAKFNPAGTALEYATWLGGSHSCNALGTDRGLGIAVDQRGNAYISGYTGSCNFPILNAFQPSFGGAQDAFIAKLNGDGALAYSSFLGGAGSQFAADVVVDAAGQAYVVGTVKNDDGFPIVNAIQPVYGEWGDYFVIKVAADGGSLSFSTFLGGSGIDGDYYDDGAITLDPFGNICVTGFTESHNFPTYNAYQSTAPNGSAGFVTKLTSDGSAFVFSTYLSGSEIWHSTLPHGIATDVKGNVYIAGSTSSPDFPLVNAYQTINDPDWTGFVTKFKADGSALLYSTYLGGNAADTFYGLAVDALGFAHIVATTHSTDLPTKLAFQPAHGGGWYDVFIAKLVPDGHALAFASYLGGTDDDRAGGVAVDQARNAYVVGYTDSPDFPLANPFQATLRGINDAYVTKMSFPERMQPQASPI